MHDIITNLKRFESCRCLNIKQGSLISRNEIAYNWKALYRNWLIRECVFWRTHDLLSQAQMLYENTQILGSRILIRSAIETIASLTYLNLKSELVLSGKLNFHEYDQLTRQLLLGTRNHSTKYESINILTVLKQSDKKYPGILEAFQTLSESAHPNYEGLCFGYCSLDRNNSEDIFSNKWQYMWGNKHIPLMKLIMYVLEVEYNERWPELIKRLEQWVEKNDSFLEATKEKLI
jgi:hypothetical protein